MKRTARFISIIVVFSFLMTNIVWTQLEAQKAFASLRPKITGSLNSGFVEGQEDGKKITVNLANGDYADDMTGKVQLIGLPAGTAIGDIERVSNKTITIALSGNSTVDYDTAKSVKITVTKDGVMPAQTSALTASISLPAIKEPIPAAPSVNFSFDGENTGKLIGIDETMEYSLDGGKKFNDVIEKDMSLTEQQIALITASYDIKVRKKATLRDPAGTIQKIDIIAGAALPKTVVGNDTTNTITGMDESMEFSLDNGVSWTKYKPEESFGDMRRSFTLKVRNFATGLKAAGAAKAFVFTATKPGLIITGSLDSEFAEGQEDRKKITLNLTNGDYSDDISEKVHLDGLPGGVTIGDIERVSDTKISIALSGDSTVDYDTAKTVKITLDNDGVVPVQPAQSRPLTASVSLPATVEQVLAAPSVSFSFDGENAGKLMGIDDTMEYSLNGGKTYNAADEEDILLTDQQIASVTASYDIKVRKEATLREPAGTVQNIDIIAGTALPKTVMGSDATNTITGMDESMEFIKGDGISWTRYESEENLGDMRGNFTLKARKCATGTTMAGAVKTFVFTAAVPGVKINGILDSKFVEGQEDGKKITVNLASGDYAEDMTGKVYINGLPDGITIGDIERVDVSTIIITLTGNSEADYDTAKTLTVGVEKEAVEPMPSDDLTCTVALPAVVEPVPSAPSVTFSFDTGKLIAIDETMEYSLDGGKTFNTVTEKDMALSVQEIASITATNDIKVRIAATLREPVGTTQKIDIVAGSSLPSTVVGSDEKNTITGMDTTMEFIKGDDLNWTRYESDESLGDMSGDFTVKVRKRATGTTMAGAAKTFVFTAAIPADVLVDVATGVRGEIDNQIIRVKNLKAGDKVSLFKSNGDKIGSEVVVAEGQNYVEFPGINLPGELYVKAVITRGTQTATRFAGLILPTAVENGTSSGYKLTINNVAYGDTVVLRKLSDRSEILRYVLKSGETKAIIDNFKAPDEGGIFVQVINSGKELSPYYVNIMFINDIYPCIWGELGGVKNVGIDNLKPDDIVFIYNAATKERIGYKWAVDPGQSHKDFLNIVISDDVYIGLSVTRAGLTETKTIGRLTPVAMEKGTTSGVKLTVSNVEPTDVVLVRGDKNFDNILKQYTLKAGEKQAVFDNLNSGEENGLNIQVIHNGEELAPCYINLKFINDIFPYIWGELGVEKNVGVENLLPGDIVSIYDTTTKNQIGNKWVVDQGYGHAEFLRLDISDNAYIGLSVTRAGLTQTKTIGRLTPVAMDKGTNSGIKLTVSNVEPNDTVLVRGKSNVDNILATYTLKEGETKAIFDNFNTSEEDGLDIQVIHNGEELAPCYVNLKFINDINTSIWGELGGKKNVGIDNLKPDDIVYIYNAATNERIGYKWAVDPGQSRKEFLNLDISDDVYLGLSVTRAGITQTKMIGRLTPIDLEKGTDKGIKLTISNVEPNDTVLLEDNMNFDNILATYTLKDGENRAIFDNLDFTVENDIKIQVIHNGQELAPCHVNLNFINEIGQGIWGELGGKKNVRVDNLKIGDTVSIYNAYDSKTIYGETVIDAGQNYVEFMNLNIPDDVYIGLSVTRAGLIQTKIIGRLTPVAVEKGTNNNTIKLTVSNVEPNDTVLVREEMNFDNILAKYTVKEGEAKAVFDNIDFMGENGVNVQVVHNGQELSSCYVDLNFIRDIWQNIWGELGGLKNVRVDNLKAGDVVSIYNIADGKTIGSEVEVGVNQYYAEFLNLDISDDVYIGLSVTRAGIIQTKMIGRLTPVALEKGTTSGIKLTVSNVEPNDTVLVRGSMNFDNILAQYTLKEGENRVVFDNLDASGEDGVNVQVIHNGQELPPCYVNINFMNEIGRGIWGDLGGKKNVRVDNLKTGDTVNIYNADDSKTIYGEDVIDAGQNYVEFLNLDISDDVYIGLSVTRAGMTQTKTIGRLTPVAVEKGTNNNTIKLTVSNVEPNDIVLVREDMNFDNILAKYTVKEGEAKALFDNIDFMGENGVNIQVVHNGQELSPCYVDLNFIRDIWQNIWGELGGKKNVRVDNLKTGDVVSIYNISDGKTIGSEVLVGENQYYVEFLNLDIPDDVYIGLSVTRAGMTQTKMIGRLTPVALEKGTNSGIKLTISNVEPNDTVLVRGSMNFDKVLAQYTVKEGETKVVFDNLDAAGEDGVNVQVVHNEQELPQCYVNINFMNEIGRGIWGEPGGPKNVRVDNLKTGDIVSIYNVADSKTIYGEAVIGAGQNYVEFMNLNIPDDVYIGLSVTRGGLAQTKIIGRLTPVAVEKGTNNNTIKLTVSNIEPNDTVLVREDMNFDNILAQYTVKEGETKAVFDNIDVMGENGVNVQVVHNGEYLSPCYVELTGTGI